ENAQSRTGPVEKCTNLQLSGKKLHKSRVLNEPRRRLTADPSYPGLPQSQYRHRAPTAERGPLRWAAMSTTGTASYEGVADLPDLVRQAVSLAKSMEFPFSCRVEQGRLLSVLAAGRRGGVIGETGTGCGVGLAWCLSAVGPETRLFSVERDEARARACQELFAPWPNVTVEQAS